MGNLQKFIKRPEPGWLSMIVGSGWQALEHFEKIEKVLPLPPFWIFIVGVLWVWVSKQSRVELPVERPKGSEVLVIRERTTTVEREYVMRRDI